MERLVNRRTIPPLPAVPSDSQRLDRIEAILHELLDAVSALAARMEAR